MKNDSYMKILTVVVFLLLTFITFSPSNSYARYGGGHRGYGHHSYHRPYPYYGKHVILPKLIAKTIIWEGIEYYYQYGIFYRRVKGAYVIVDSPVGAVVESIPSEYKVVVINDKTYYYYNDIYFVKKSKGYKVVEDPIYHIVKLPKDVKIIEDTKTMGNVSGKEEEYTVNILNENGSYTSVKIIKSNDGFIGPQGEYYTEFPKVAQLRLMYGKQ